MYNLTTNLRVNVAGIRSGKSCSTNFEDHPPPSKVWQCFGLHVSRLTSIAGHCHSISTHKTEKCPTFTRHYHNNQEKERENQFISNVIQQKILQIMTKQSICYSILVTPSAITNWNWHFHVICEPDVCQWKQNWLNCNITKENIKFSASVRHRTIFITKSYSKV